jgi:hypothetical protein
LAANPPNLPETNASIERIIKDARAADRVMQHIRGLFKQESFEKSQVSDPRKHEVSIDWQSDEHLPAVSGDLTLRRISISMNDQHRRYVCLSILISNAMEALEAGNRT